MLKHLTPADVNQISLLAREAVGPLSDAPFQRADQPYPGHDDKRLARAALREAIHALSKEARNELLALMWIGRGDFGGSFQSAVEHAQGRSTETDPHYVAEKARALPVYLQTGLEQLGIR
jgi:hypothetical protein